MTVKELIKILETKDSNKEVCIEVEYADIAVCVIDGTEELCGVNSVVISAANYK